MSKNTSKTTFGQLLAVIFAVGFGWYGWTQAELSGEPAWQGAGIFAILGASLGFLTAFIIRTAIQFAILGLILLIALILFRGRFEDVTGIDPLAWLEQYFNL